jgi:hypothetical protein
MNTPKKIYYGKYNWWYNSLFYNNDIEGVDKLDKYIKEKTNYLNNIGIFDVKWVLRKTKDKQCLYLTCYYKYEPKTTI